MYLDKHQLHSGSKLLSVDVLKSPNGEYAAWMQDDGNFVVYKGGAPIWASNSQGGGSGPYTLHMQEDNNLAIFAKGEQEIWSSGTKTGHATAKTGYLEMQDSGNLVIYRGDGIRLWESGTSGGHRSKYWKTGHLLQGNKITSFDTIDATNRHFSTSKYDSTFYSVVVDYTFVGTGVAGPNEIWDLESGRGQGVAECYEAVKLDQRCVI